MMAPLIFGDSLTSNNTLLGNLSLTFDRPIKCKTVNYIDQSKTTVLVVYSVSNIYIFSRLIANWSVENMNLDVTPYEMLVYFHRIKN
jgi:hypothetical protein